jgi:hypothetical protein
MSSQPASRQAPDEVAAISDLKLLDDLLTKPISYHPALIRIGGSAAAGILLSQLLYWSSKPKRDANGWIYKTEADWMRETGLSATEQHRARRELKARGLIEEKRGGYLNRIHFRPCRARIAALLTGEAVSEASSPGVAKRTQNLRRGRAGAAQSVRQQEVGSVVSMFEFRGGNARPDLASRSSGVQSSENRGTGSPKIGELVSRSSGVPTHRLPQETTQEITHTPAQPSSVPMPLGVCGSSKSKFSFDQRRSYAENNFDRSGNKLGAGWLKTSADGEYDELIADWYDRQGAASSDRRQHGNAATRTPDPSCPLCLGTGKEAVKDANGRTVAVKASCKCKRASEGARVAV